MSLYKDFLQKSAWLFSGLFIAQAINFLFALVLPRIYNPSQFAVFGLFLSTTLILFEVNSFRLDQALMLPKTDEESIYIYRKAVLFSTLLAVVIAFAWWAYYSSLYYESKYYQLVYLPVSIFLQGIIQPSVTFSNKKEKYSLINTARVLQALVMGTVSCLPFFLHNQKIYLIEGFVAGQIMAVVIYSKLTFSNLKKVMPQNTYSIRPYQQFPKYGTWSSLFNTISRNSVVYVLNYFFSPFTVGIYTFTNRVVQAPLNLVAGAMGQAFFRDASQHESEEQKTLTNYVQKILMQLAVLPVVILLFFGPDLFQLVFGSEWREAGLVARYLSVWYGVGLVVTPLSTMIDIKKKLKWELGYNIVYAIVRISILLLFSYWGDFKLTMIAFCIVSVIFNLYLLIFVRQIVFHEN
ncbi:MAG: oligosaccharide flippase family protein [Chitinophagales bacterium]|nr:oligosaccharide flippase family protein [Chitinophagales bacterium]